MPARRYQDINAETIDRWVDQGWEWGQPIDHATFACAAAGEWDVVLTPRLPVPHWWFGDLRGRRVLGLAAGGGQQMPVLAAAGAVCTVLDYSERQLESELLVAEREGYDITIVRADMTERLPFEDESFDLVFHPVSNCYIQDVQHVWDEVARVLVPGGRLLAGLDNGFNFVVDVDDESHIVGRLPFDPLANAEQMAELDATDSGVQFSHTIGEQIGGQLRTGLELLDVYDDTNGEGYLHEHGVPTFWATLSRKRAKSV